VREWTLTLPSEFPFWELESQAWWSIKSLENDCKGQNTLDCKVIYIIGKVLEHKCVKWARMTHLDTLNTSYGQKKGHESNCQFDSRPLKVKNFLDFLACRWCTTYCWKNVDKGYNFALYLTSIRGLHINLWASKVTGVSILGILGLPFRSFKTKWHLGVGLVVRHIVYYKGEGGGFPQVRAVVSLLSSCLPMHQRCSSYALTNLLFRLCKSVWVIKLIVNHLSPHPGAPTCPFTLEVL